LKDARWHIEKYKFADSPDNQKGNAEVLHMCQSKCSTRSGSGLALTADSFQLQDGGGFPLLGTNQAGGWWGAAAEATGFEAAEGLSQQRGCRGACRRPQRVSAALERAVLSSPCLKKVTRYTAVQE
jgi:hypothetical protein